MKNIQLQATGYSAKVLATAKHAIALMLGCPYGREVLAQMLAAVALKGTEFELCREAVRTMWLKLLLSSGVVKSVNGTKHKIVVVLETPILLATSYWNREQRR